MAILEAMGLTPARDPRYDLGDLAARIGITKGMWGHLGFTKVYKYPTAGLCH